MSKIELCKKCVHKSFNKDLDIICGLTQQEPNYKDICYQFDTNISQTLKVESLTPLRPNYDRAKFAQIFLYIILTVELFSIVSKFFQIDLLKDMKNGVTVTIIEANLNDLRELIINILYIIAYILSIVFFIMWFRRAYYNLHLRVKNLSCSEGWAAGVWFVPILNLFRPFNIMSELYRETKKYLIKNNRLNFNIPEFYIVIWWTMWIFIGFSESIINQLYKNSTKLQDLIEHSYLDVFTSIFNIILGFITIIIIKNYSKLEDLLIKK